MKVTSCEGQEPCEKGDCTEFDIHDADQIEGVIKEKGKKGAPGADRSGQSKLLEAFKRYEAGEVKSRRKSQEEAEKDILQSFAKTVLAKTPIIATASSEIPNLKSGMVILFAGKTSSGIAFHRVVTQEASEIGKLLLDYELDDLIKDKVLHKEDRPQMPHIPTDVEFAIDPDEAASAETATRKLVTAAKRRATEAARTAKGGERTTARNVGGLAGAIQDVAGEPSASH